MVTECCNDIIDKEKASYWGEKFDFPSLHFLLHFFYQMIKCLGSGFVKVYMQSQVFSKGVLDFHREDGLHHGTVVLLRIG